MKTKLQSKLVTVVTCGALVFLTSSCKPSSKAKAKSSSTSTSTSSGRDDSSSSSPSYNGDTSGNNPGCYAAGVNYGNNSAVSDYYTTPRIVQKGKSAGVIAWSSNLDPRLSGSQELFRTDSRLNVRVLVKPAPSQGTYVNGVNCSYIPAAYNKLQVRVGIKKPGASYFTKEYVFNNISIDSCSEVFEFNPGGSNGDPWIIQVLDVKWDWSCMQYELGQISPLPSFACPWAMVHTNYCYEIALQWSTDYTKDIPH